LAGYAPLKITGNSTGLVKNREEFILPDDAYPILQNAYVWRERILRKKGYALLGRLQRVLANYPATSAPLLGSTDGSGNFSGNLFNILIGLALISNLEEPQIVLGSVGIHVNSDGTYVDDSMGNLSNGSGGTGTINYITGDFTLLNSGQNLTNVHLYSLQYYPGLPVMGIRIRELQNSANDQTIFFDQIYAYNFNSGTNAFQEFIPGTTWNAAGEDNTGTDFFWSTNYWTGAPLISTSSMPPAYTTAFTTTNKLFWETNESGHSGANADPPRITDGVTWLDFYHDTAPTINSPWAQIDAGPTWLTNWLCNLPYRGRMVVFNTWEGISAGSAQNYSNRIRWSTIGNRQGRQQQDLGEMT
jgi:hypothetical protein